VRLRPIHKRDCTSGTAYMGHPRQDVDDDLSRLSPEPSPVIAAVRGAYHGIQTVRYVELKMTLDDFRQSLTATERPAGLTLALAGLWWDAKGNWAASGLALLRHDHSGFPPSRSNQYMPSCSCASTRNPKD
jgi:hypothetical protein